MALVLTPNDDWVPISVTKPETKTRPGPVKTQPSMNEDSEIAFFTQIFKWNDTVFPGVYVQFFFQVVSMFAASACAKYLIAYSKIGDDVELVRKFDMPADVGGARTALTFFVAVLIVFYSKNSYSNFVEGRKILGGFCNNCREMCQNAFTQPLKDGADIKKVEYLRKLIRRKLNLMLVFMRQHAREGEGDNGFMPGSQLHASGESFVAQGEGMNWFKDPVSPPVYHLVSEEEVTHYSKKKTGMRPAMVQAELNLIAGELSTEMRYPDHFMDLWLQNSEDTMNLFKSMYRIIDTPIPMPYKHMLYIVVFLYVFLTPWIEADKSIGDGWVDIGNSVFNADDTADDDDKAKLVGLSKNDGQGFTQGWVTSLLNCLCFYGLLELSVALFNPFGHDPIDHDIGSFCGKANGEMFMIAKMSKSSKGADMTDYTKAPPSDA